MAIETKPIWTKSLVASTLTIDGSYNLRALSIIMIAGTGTIRGSMLLNNGTPSVAIPLALNIPIEINTGTTAGFIDFLEITATGTVLIIGR